MPDTLRNPAPARSSNLYSLLVWQIVQFAGLADCTVYWSGSCSYFLVVMRFSFLFIPGWSTSRRIWPASPSKELN